MRLTPFQIQEIKKAFSAHFLPQDSLWLFGSRIDESKQGGDIDLYIETCYEDLSRVVKEKISFLSNRPLLKFIL